MKPHLSYRHKVWSCAAADWQTTRIVGFGWTVREAWDDWKALGGNQSSEAGSATTAANLES